MSSGHGPLISRTVLMRFHDQTHGSVDPSGTVLSVHIEFELLMIWVSVGV
jgi:hypothetical protein